MADRYLYMCLPGLSLCLAAVLQRWYSKRLVIISCLMLLILSVLTVVQNSYWRDSQILWRHAIKVNPQSSGARWFGALTAIEKGEYETAKEHLHKMIEINRFFMLAYYHLAKVEEKSGNLKEALKNYEFFASYGVMTGNLEEVARVKAYLPVLRARINRGG
jgi:tetratricopeptide (TPR) repeat protein